MNIKKQGRLFIIQKNTRWQWNLLLLLLKKEVSYFFPSEHCNILKQLIVLLNNEKVKAKSSVFFLNKRKLGWR